MSAEPHLSIVATSRNDDHGGNLLRRMQLFVNGWIEQCKRHSLASELLLVEWNPPQDRPALADALRWPTELGPCSVRIITVPPEVHRRYRHSEALPLFQMIAKNVGIRRARAPFVLATNIDILFNDELVSHLASRQLEKGRLYRIDRSDAMADVPPAADLAEQLEYCRTHLLRVNGREATFALGSNSADSGHDPESARAGIDFSDGFGLERTAAGGTVQAAGAEALLRLRPQGNAVLRLLVDAGPNPRRDELVLKARERSGREVTQIRFRGLQRLYIPLQDAPGGELTLLLSVESVRARRWGPRALHLRVIEWGWATAEEVERECTTPAWQASATACRDIYRPESGIALLDGWGDRAWSRCGRLFRSVRDGASFAVYTNRRLPGRLVMDLDSDRPTRMELHSESRLLTSSTIQGAQRLTIPTPPRGQPTRLRLRLPDAAIEPTGLLRVCSLQRVGLGPFLRRIERMVNPRLDYLHTNACGDFTLMHRDQWFRLRGYPEWAAYSMSIDGFLCYAAHADGAIETMLREPRRIFHIEHAVGSGWSPQGEPQLYQRITSKGIPWVTKGRVLALARQMYRKGPLVVNTPAWGLGDEPLPETRPGGHARADAPRHRKE